MKLLSQTEVARRLGISTAHARTLDSVLKPIKVIGGCRVYPEAHVERVAGARDSKARKRTVRK